MKRTISILLVFGVLLQTFSKLAILISYELNKGFIVKQLCENRDKPKMNCNGKCHLKKQLQKDEKKQQSPLGQEKDNKEIQLFNDDILFASFNNFESGNIKYIFNDNFIAIDSITSIFHPPPQQLT